MQLTVEEIDELVEEIDEDDSSMIQMLIGGILYDARKVKQCRVCNSPYRKFIEAEVIKGTYYTVIAGMLVGRDVGILPHPTKWSLANHMKKGHAPVKHVVHRRLMERIQEESGDELNEEIGTLVNKVVLAHAVIGRAHERLVVGDIEPTLNDAAQFARLLDDFERRYDASGITEAVWRDAVYAYMEILAPEIPPERREIVSRKLESNPTLLALTKALEQRALEAQTVQGEVER